MIARGFGPSADVYSPRRRTALLLSGVGTAGAYHAGVLRALHEAGVKLDVVAGRGIGAVGAMFAAIDSEQQLWSDKGFWEASEARRFYEWRPLLRIVVLAVVISVLLVAMPLAAIAAGLIVFPIDFLIKMLGGSAAGSLVQRYLGFADAAFAPTALPTWLPRLVLVVLGGAALAAVAMAWLERGARRRRGFVWWRMITAPLSTSAVESRCWEVLWQLVRGAAQLKEPPPRELARRYTEMVSENLGQPGFRELVLTAHDIDARRDLVFALVGEGRRRDLIRRTTSREAEARRAEVIDLAGVGREHFEDAIRASLAIPLVTEPHTIELAAESYWRGETHRICDRPASLSRLVEELESLEVPQIILVTAAPDPASAHGLVPWRLDVKGRLGEYLHSAEAAAVRDVLARTETRIFVIRPAHNPLGPFDVRGGFDDRSDRPQPLEELMNRGYQDAYQQFIEPIVAASGEQIS
jgi:hypothetical protein